MRTARRPSTASGNAYCSPVNPLTNLPPRIVPRASMRRSAHSTSRHGTVNVSRTRRSRNTTPHRASSCSASASASSSASSVAETAGTIDHRPAARAGPRLPARRSRGRCDDRAEALPYSSARRASNPSEVTNPRATASHSAPLISAGSRRCAAARSAANRAPRVRRASTTSCVSRAPGSSGVRVPRVACSSHGRSSRTATVIGVAREVVPPRRGAASSEPSLRTERRPHATSPARHRSSSHAGR